MLPSPCPPAFSLLLILSLLILLFGAHDAAAENGDGGETLDDWDDVSDALRPFDEHNAACAACTYVGNRVLAGWTKYAYKLKKWSAKKKRKKARKAVRGACGGISKLQIALGGDGASKKFDEFTTFMSGGSIGNINMNGKFGLQLETLCQLVVARAGDSLAEKMSNVDRMYDYNLQKDLCQDVVPSCGRKGRVARNKRKDGHVAAEDREQEAEESAAAGDEDDRSGREAPEAEAFVVEDGAGDDDDADTIEL